MTSKWVPLEASPDVFNEWSRSLGLPDSPLSFQDLFSLDEEFLQFVPKPVKAVLLLFPQRGKLAEARKEEEERGEGKWDGDVWYIKQTIPNACGSIGLLHALLNLPSSGEYALKQDSPLIHFKTASVPLSPLDRAKLLDKADFFEAAHTVAAQSGQSAVPQGEDVDVDTHFITFIEAENSKGEKRVVELDGGRNGPFDRGLCNDLLKDVAKIVQDKYIAQSDEINFTMLVLAGDQE
ncbi:peptidase C12, ubiquitin carboxyl-terminal hydrolase [Kockovaella imperatae]|uniref:Ubiquitin carboxyl-terminal hydrolase n=1 Tax=Kockovaella imperatae TaxID=4999 RepID=A0A1Y1UF26_9TREE|nr:peptidase C12, ubiquitin carboxyl-terminal hydrolase [Kockovaella imperatae]ORX36618.1 peptidase C12, ubiquitin carboxyl-terminal hydrolase [Kockovaella imperatae]